MIYCKNCGKALKDGTRFCDRCGQSVRRSKESGEGSRNRQIEELQRERLRRSRERQEQEKKERRLARLKQEKKLESRQRKLKFLRKHRFGILIALAVIILTAVIAVITYAVTSANSSDAPWKQQDQSMSETATPVPTMTAIESGTPQTPLPSVSNLAQINENKDKTNAEGYRVCEINKNVSFPYPSEFELRDNEGKQKLNAVERIGGATLSVYSEEYPGGTPSALMKEYAKKAGGSVEYSLAGSSSYVITIEDAGIVHHRKCVIDGDSDSIIYYDLEYDKSSSEADEYETAAKYMDENFPKPAESSDKDSKDAKSDKSDKSDKDDKSTQSDRK